MASLGRALRRHPNRDLARTSIILLTALNDPREAVQATQAVQVFTKPVAFGEMVRAVERHCGL